MTPFVYNQLPARVVFGVGALEKLSEEVERLSVRRALVLSTPEQTAQAEQACKLLGERCAGLFDRAVMHVPVETARAAIDEARRLDAQCAVAIGGGSTTGLAKAIALESGMPIIAVPTTYAGSEMSPVYGLTEANVKKTGRDARVLPRTVIYDPLLTTSLPLAMSFASGMNAIAHAVEGLYAREANPVTSLFAEEGIRMFARGLRRLKQNADDLQARADCLYASCLCGSVFGTVGGALHHKLCHTLGGSWNLPHAETHSVVLPHVVAFNAPAVPDVMARIARALGTVDASQGLYDLTKSLGTPLSLAALGMPEADLDRAADLAGASPYWNPRLADRAALRRILQAAHAGQRPAAHASGPDA